MTRLGGGARAAISGGVGWIAKSEALAGSGKSDASGFGAEPRRVTLRGRVVSQPGRRAESETGVLGICPLRPRHHCLRRRRPSSATLPCIKPVVKLPSAARDTARASPLTLCNDMHSHRFGSGESPSARSEIDQGPRIPCIEPHRRHPLQCHRHVPRTRVALLSPDKTRHQGGLQKLVVCPRSHPQPCRRKRCRTASRAMAQPLTEGKARWRDSRFLDEHNRHPSAFRLLP